MKLKEIVWRFVLKIEKSEYNVEMGGKVNIYSSSKNRSNPNVECSNNKNLRKIPYKLCLCFSKFIRGKSFKIMLDNFDKKIQNE